MVVQCTHCGNRLAPDPRYAGSTTACPVCSEDLYVPLEDGDYGGPSIDSITPGERYGGQASVFWYSR